MAWGRYLYHPILYVDFAFEPMDLNNGSIVDMVNNTYKDCDGDLKAFRAHLEQAKKLMYLGCTKFTKLVTFMKLFNNR